MAKRVKSNRRLTFGKSYEKIEDETYQTQIGKELKSLDEDEIFACNIVPGISRTIQRRSHLDMSGNIKKQWSKFIGRIFEQYDVAHARARAAREGREPTWDERIFDLRLLSHRRLYAHSNLGVFSSRTSMHRSCTSVTSETTRFRSLRLVGATGFRAEHVTTGSAR